MKWMLITLALTLAFGCAPALQYDYSRQINRAQWNQRFTSYAWATDEGTVNIEHPLMDSRAIHNWVMPPVDSLLQAQGLERLVDPERSDLVVSFHWLLRQQLEDIHNMAPYAMEWYQKGTYIKTKDFRQKNSALLLIRIRQRWPDQPVWSGWAAAHLRGSNPEKAFIQKATSVICRDLQDQ